MLLLLLLLRGCSESSLNTFLSLWGLKSSSTKCICCENDRLRTTSGEELLERGFNFIKICFLVLSGFLSFNSRPSRIRQSSCQSSPQICLLHNAIEMQSVPWQKPVSRESAEEFGWKEKKKATGNVKEPTTLSTWTAMVWFFFCPFCVGGPC